MSKQKFDNMKAQIHRLRPDLDEGALKHIANLCSNKLRSINTDVYDVVVTKERQSEGIGYYRDVLVDAKSGALWLRVWVD